MRTMLLTALLLLDLAALANAPATAAQQFDPAAVDKALQGPALGDAYFIGPEDILRVTVFNEPQLSGTFKVDRDGRLDYPLLGHIPASGLTTADITQELEARLADGYLRNPQLSVEVEQFRSQSVLIMGAVRTPGRYTLPGRMTVIEALAQAGSTTPSAGSDVLILRPGTSGADPVLPESLTVTEVSLAEAALDQDTEIVRVNLSDVQRGALSQNVLIRDGDTIFVPEAARFFVTGYVRNPGSYVLQPGMTVMQAISVAGGVSERGSSGRVRILRAQGPETVEIDVEETDPVRPGDTIRVRRRLL